MGNPYGYTYGYPYAYPYGYPYMGSQGSLGWDTLGWDTLGGPMGPWDRWDLGTDGTWASRTPDHKTAYRLYYEVVYRYPAPPGLARQARQPGRTEKVYFYFFR